MKNIFKIIKSGIESDLINAIENGIDINKKNLFGKTPLDKSFELGWYNMILVLYQHGVDISKLKQESDLFFVTDKQEMYNILFNKSVEFITKFSKNHKDKNFYAFAFDYRYEYGNIILNFNTITSFKQSLKEYKEMDPDLYNNDDYIEELKWNPGDWKYQNFANINILPKFEKHSYHDVIDNVIKSLFSEGIFKSLNITSDFKAIITEYD